MRRRIPRRQGVVYGPLTRQERADSGGFVGRIFGALIVLGALGTLAVGGMNFMGAASPGGPAAPTSTSGAVAGPTPSPSPTRRPTATPAPTPSPTATPTASPTASPTPVAVEVREGPGFVTLGRNYRTGPARVVDPSATFGTSGRIAWMANLGGPAGSDEVDIVVARLDPDGADTPTWEEAYEPTSPNSAVFLRRFRNIGALIDGPGTYVVRYSVDGEVRAEGFFRVEDD